jgi:hypothetical protein
MMNNYALLEQAIEHREQVTAVYDGERREFCPHVLGTKNGVKHVLGYQFAGGSTHGLPEGGEWRCFAVDGLMNIATHPGPWHTSANIFNPQSCLDTIDLVVQPAPPLAARSR